MTLLSFLAGGVGIVAVAALGTMLLPRHVVVERSSRMVAAPQDIVALAASNAGYQQFNPYLSADPALKIKLFGPDHGVGSGFEFDGKDGKGSQTVAAVAEDHVRYAIDLGAMGKPQQMISAQRDGEATQVTWRMEMDLGYNPIARGMGLFMDRMVGGTFEAGLNNLATALARAS